jgi:hypothetical protein
MKSLQKKSNIPLFIIITTVSGLTGVVVPLVEIGNVNYIYEFLIAFSVGIICGIAIFLFERFRYLRVDATSQYKNTHLWKFAYYVYFFCSIYFRFKEEEVTMYFVIFAFGIYFLVLAVIILMIRKNQRIFIV